MCKKAILLVSYVILLTGMVGNVFADTNASAPSPSDGATAVQLFPMVTLTWTPGAYVAPYVSGPNGNGEKILPRGRDKNNIFKSVRSAFIKAGLSHCFLGVKLL